MRYPTSGASIGAKRALIQLACALLLFAQQVGLAHAVWHAAHQVPAKEQRADEQSPDRPATREASKLCVLDAIFGQVLGAGPIACHHFPAEAQTAATPVHASQAFTPVERLTPRSRGPPSLL